MSFVDIAVHSAFKLNPSYATYLAKLGNGGNCSLTLFLKLKARKWEGYPALTFFFFNISRTEIRICSFRYFKGKEFGLARNQLSRGCETDPVLDSCCESCSGYYLASHTLQGFWSFWLLTSFYTLRAFTLEPKECLQKKIKINKNKSNFKYISQ